MAVKNITDSTIREADGQFAAIEAVMKGDTTGPWMLSTHLMVVTQVAAFEYELRFWDNGDVFIVKTEHPLSLEIPIDDLYELKEWCIQRGWKRLTLLDQALDDHADLEFWYRIFNAGIIEHEVLARREEERMRRANEASDDDTPTGPKTVEMRDVYQKSEALQSADV